MYEVTPKSMEVDVLLERQLTDLCAQIDFPDFFDDRRNHLLLPDRSIVPFAEIERLPEKQCIGVYQGTFDPPTLTHRQVIDRSLEIVDKVVVYPTNKNSKKSPVALAHRIAMLFLTESESN